MDIIVPPRNGRNETRGCGVPSEHEFTGGVLNLHVTWRKSNGIPSAFNLLE